jgi:hypothetical protein
MMLMTAKRREAKRIAAFNYDGQFRSWVGRAGSGTDSLTTLVIARLLEHDARVEAQPVPSGL